MRSRIRNNGSPIPYHLLTIRILPKGHKSSLLESEKGRKYQRIGGETGGGDSSHSSKISRIYAALGAKTLELQFPEEDCVKEIGLFRDTGHKK